MKQVLRYGLLAIILVLLTGLVSLDSLADNQKDKDKTSAKTPEKVKAEWINTLLKKLKDKDLWVRVEAIKKLGDTKDRRVARSLRKALNDESLDINVEALRALEKIGDRESFRLLRQASILYDVKALRFYSLRAAAKLDPEKTRTYLEDNLHSQFPNTRRNSAEALGHLFSVTENCDKDSVKKLIAILTKEKDPVVKEKIDASLRKMTNASFKETQKKWLEWWQENKKDIGAPAKIKVVVSGQGKTPSKNLSPKAKEKLVAKKKAEKKFNAFQDKKILDKKPADEKIAVYFTARTSTGKKLAVDAFGNGNQKTLTAVEDALNWLARHQEKEGFWDYDGYTKHCSKSSKETKRIKKSHDIAVTGLALLAFLGAGHTHQPGQQISDGLPSGGKYKPNVERALKWLLKVQKDDGSFSAPGSLSSQKINMFDQGLATLAISEAYGMTGDPKLKKPVEKAIRFIFWAKNEDRVWRYTPQCNDNDTSVAGWQIFALKSAKVSGLPVKRQIFVDASQWMDDMTDARTGRVGYSKRGQGKSTMTSIGIMCRTLMGWRNDSPLLMQGAELVLKDPSWKKKKVNYYHIYQTSLAMFQMGDPYWSRWEDQMTNLLLSTVKRRGCEKGSWTPINAQWSKCRVYTTALSALSLEVYYRYLPFAR
ncbi:MAG: HEAT repeat domain-containing protein [Planctomycetes bacterium]|nr:HEAT repeat domain-containing protein [Planctomycetota bacterium]